MIESTTPKIVSYDIESLLIESSLKQETHNQEERRQFREEKKD